VQEPTPWFTPASFPQFKVIVDLLEGAAPRLLAEFWDLWGSGALTADVECIHNPTRGVWRAHSVGAPWQAPGSAPVARQLVNAIAAVQALPIIRAEYSALDGGGHISPHYGMTNGTAMVGGWLSLLDVVPLHRTGYVPSSVGPYVRADGRSSQVPPRAGGAPAGWPWGRYQCSLRLPHCGRAVTPVDARPCPDL
jgi:hypothetical protein